jgi:hypothetical protein
MYGDPDNTAKGISKIRIATADISGAAIIGTTFNLNDRAVRSHPTVISLVVTGTYHHQSVFSFRI